MKYSWMRITSGCLVACCALVAAPPFGRVVNSQTKEPTSQALVLSARMERGTLIYKVDGRRVEDSVSNSLLTNLAEIVRTRGTQIPVFIIIDVRAPFSEVGKLETALDKTDLTHYRLFVSNFSDGVMNEIHWDEKGIPIPGRN